MPLLEEGFRIGRAYAHEFRRRVLEYFSGRFANKSGGYANRAKAFGDPLFVSKLWHFMVSHTRPYC